MSKGAESYLKESGIYVEQDSLVESVLDTAKKAKCPFEKLAAKITNPAEAYRQLRVLQDSLRECK
jgi:hypothetical protein